MKGEWPSAPAGSDFVEENEVYLDELPKKRQNRADGHLPNSTRI